MPIIPRVGRRSPKMVAVIAGLYLVLIVGGASMVFPFLLMLSTSITQDTDYRFHKVVPDYLHDDLMLWGKFLDAKYHGNYRNALCAKYREEYFRLEDVVIGELDLESPVAGRWELVLTNPQTGRPYTVEELQALPADERPVVEQGQVAVVVATEDGARVPVRAPGRGRLEYLEPHAKFLAGKRFDASDFIVEPHQSIATLVRVMPEVRLDERQIRRIRDWYEFKASLPVEYTFTYYWDTLVTGKSQIMFQDWMAQRYGSDVDAYNATHPDYVEYFQDIDLAIERHDGHNYLPEESLLLSESREFRKTLPPEFLRVLFPEELWSSFLARIYDNRIEELNADWGTTYVVFSEIPFPYTMPDHPLAAICWTDFLHSKWPMRWVTVDVDEAASEDFRRYLEEKYGTPETFSQRTGVEITSFDEIEMPSTPPREHPAYFIDWMQYLDSATDMAALTPEEQTAYRRHVVDWFGGLEAYNEATGSTAASLEDIEIPAAPPANVDLYYAWWNFVKFRFPTERIHPVSGTRLYQLAMKEKFGTLDALNAAYGTDFASWDEVWPPFRETDFYEFTNGKRDLRLYFLKKNYIMVFRYLVLKGRSVVVTLLFVGAAILTQLTVMPLAAFALSRFRLPYTHRILLFLLATMAFPAEVSMIPNFLLMKELHLLNTLWALILPGMANGFGVFLLKGFFDSLPSELFEAAMIEGAGELTMFRHITVPLSKPILAVIALGAFNAAYGSFTWALLICQDRRWWTLMVWLFDFQNGKPQYIVTAALVLAAIPTLLVFIFCQNIILRGIIIPTFK